VPGTSDSDSALNKDPTEAPAHVRPGVIYHNFKKRVSRPYLSVPSRKDSDKSPTGARAWGWFWFIIKFNFCVCDVGSKRHLSLE